VALTIRDTRTTVAANVCIELDDAVPEISGDEVIFTNVPTLSGVVPMTAFSYDRHLKAVKIVEDSRQLTRWLRRLCGALTQVD
jgi:hypothetical protein